MLALAYSSYLQGPTNLKTVSQPSKKSTEPVTTIGTSAHYQMDSYSPASSFGTLDSYEGKGDTLLSDSLMMSLPYRGPWLPDSDEPDGIVHGTPSTPMVALITSNQRGVDLSKVTGLPIIMVNPDSGCTASVTPWLDTLIDVRSCREVFGQANGFAVYCTHIGNLPLIARTKEGPMARFLITNVRFVESFKYTLISVDQLWEEQRVDARFRDLHHLQFPPEAGNIRIPYDPNA